MLSSMLEDGVLALRSDGAKDEDRDELLGASDEEREEDVLWKMREFAVPERDSGGRSLIDGGDIEPLLGAERYGDGPRL